LHSAQLGELEAKKGFDKLYRVGCLGALCVDPQQAGRALARKVPRDSFGHCFDKYSPVGNVHFEHEYCGDLLEALRKTSMR